MLRHSYAGGALCVFLAAVVLASCATSADGPGVLTRAVAGQFEPTERMPMCMLADYSAVPLASGEVLVIPEQGPTWAIYDPHTVTWREVPTTPGGFYGAAATLLDSGLVLVCGGWINGSAAAACSLYDATSGASAATGSMNEPRVWHSATRLRDGKVVVLGGCHNGPDDTATAEVYDPMSGTWSPAGALNVKRRLHHGVLLADGNVLVIGGTGATAELYDPATGTFRDTSLLTNWERFFSTATLLADGRVLVVGGGTAVLYDPVADWAERTAPPPTLRTNHAAALLPNGTVLIAGGEDASNDALATAEVFDPITGAWSPTGSMAQPRYSQAAALLPTGKVLVAGNSASWDCTAELYDPGPGTACQVCQSDGPCVLLDTGVSCGTCAACDGSGACAQATATDPACVVDCTSFDDACRSFASETVGGDCAGLGTCATIDPGAVCTVSATFPGVACGTCMECDPAGVCAAKPEADPGCGVDCSTFDTQCRTYASATAGGTCSGLGECALIDPDLECPDSTVPVGASCDDGDDTTTADVCQEDGTCRGTLVGAPAAGCGCASTSSTTASAWTLAMALILCVARRWRRVASGSPRWKRASWSESAEVARVTRPVLLGTYLSHPPPQPGENLAKSRTWRPTRRP
jgi:hypothetical protein